MGRGKLKELTSEQIDKLLYVAWDAEAVRTAWVPVRDWREKLKSLGVKDTFKIEREILDSDGGPTEDGGYYFDYHGLRIYTIYGSEGVSGLGGYSRFAYLKIIRKR